jgi:hypothetical protein
MIRKNGSRFSEKIMRHSTAARLPAAAGACNRFAATPSYFPIGDAVTPAFQAGVDSR